MKIIEYNKYSDIIVEFQDKWKSKVHTNYGAFINGMVKNPYHPSVYGVGMIGNKYPISINHNNIKEYVAWRSMLKRCFNKKEKERYPKYKDVTCCEEWLLYENFYEWLHSQENFDKWLNGYNWDIDKDILLKNNKVYNPDTCCLVPVNVNNLFLKCDATRGSFPIGVSKYNNKFIAYCFNPFIKKRVHLGSYQSLEQAFQTYKQYKENIIKQMAKIEFEKGNITDKCYNAMMKYEVDFND